MKLSWRIGTALIVVCGIAGCGGVIVPDGLIHPDCEADAWVEVVVLDVWGRSISSPSIRGFSHGAQAQLAEGSVMTWEVAVDGFVPTTVTAAWSGEETASSLSVQATGGARVATSLDVLNVGGKGCRVHGLFVGLDHPWYAASGRAPRAGNRVTLLLDGQEFWAAVHADLTDPDRESERVHLTTWWWMSDFELIRPDDHHELGPAERWTSTMMSILERRGGHNRVAVARFAENTAPGMAYLNTDPLLRAKARDPDDAFEVMLQGNPAAAPLEASYTVPERPFSFVARVRENPQHAWRGFHQPVAQLAAALETLEAASYHQKALIVDHDVAYISGMNVKSTDWDTNDHRLFDHRRMRFNATREEREAVIDRQMLPDLGPRKDYGIRIEGPTARDFDDVLRRRWDHGLATGAMFAEDATPYELLAAAPVAGDVTAQIVVTMPDPIQERSILETLLKAGRNATDLIYIEDQYWRAPVLHESMRAAMEEHPDLHLVVVTKPVAFADGGKKHTVLADEEFRNAFPDRYLLIQLKVFDREGDQIWFDPMDVHSKIQIVDDVYVCVGSANKNNRGLLYEGELNAAVHDPPFATAARNRILANIVGAEHVDEVIDRTGAEIFQALKALAEQNAVVEATLAADPTADVTPQGFVYPLVISPAYLLEVGPDFF